MKSKHQGQASRRDHERTGFGLDPNLPNHFLTASFAPSAGALDRDHGEEGIRTLYVYKKVCHRGPSAVRFWSFTPTATTNIATLP